MRRSSATFQSESPRRRAALFVPLLLLCALGGRGASAEHEKEGRGRAEPIFPIPCEKLGPAEAQKFLDQEAGKHPYPRSEEVVAYLESCKNDIAPGKRLACLARLHQHSSRYLNGNYFRARHLGFELDDETYLRTRPRDAIALPADFADGIPKEFIRETEKAPTGAFHYVSAMNGSHRLLFRRDDDKYARFFVAIKTDDKDADLRKAHDMGMIAIDKRTRPPKIHFYEYTYKDGSYTLNPLMGNCVGCHTSGLLTITPHAGGVNEKELKAVDAMNAGIRELMKNGVDWDGTYRPDLAGPVLGEKQGCTSCHDGKDRPPITLFTNRTILQAKLFHLRGMPPSKEGKELAERLRDTAKLPLAARSRILEAYLGNNFPNPDYNPNHSSGRYVPQVALQELFAAGLLSEKDRDRLTAVAKRIFDENGKLVDEMTKDEPGVVRAWLTAVPCDPKGK